MIVKWVRGVNLRFSLVFVLTQALYEIGNEWLGTHYAV